MSKLEALEAMCKFEKDIKVVLKEFKMYYRVRNLVVKPIIKFYPMGYAVEADLYVGGELVKHYEIADLLLMDLNELMLKHLLRSDDYA